MNPPRIPLTEITRRQWFARIGPAAVDAVLRPLEARVERYFPPQRRPPGAKAEIVFRALCTACGECSKACPHDAIFTFNEESGANVGTPVMIPDRNPCQMCEDLPCVSACGEGALELSTGGDGIGRVDGIGCVEVAESRCLAKAGPDCGACANLCPGDVDALSFAERVPVVERSECVGCGLCIEACPVNPPAIVLLAL